MRETIRFLKAWKEGCLVATIKDVARRAGVSTSTVSKYINGGNLRQENAETIRQAIQEMDYRVNPFARGLKTHRSKSIGVLLPSMSAPFYGTVVISLEKTLREHGYHCLISCYSSQHGLERDNLQFLISNGVDGLIYAPEDLSAEEFYELTSIRSIPVVQIDRMIQGVESDMVLVDNSDAVFQAVSRLIERGHRRIALISGPKSVFSAKERQVGYLRALAAYGIPYNDNLLVSDENVFATGYRGFGLLMQQPEPPTAVMTTNYDITMGLITAARERGMQIPEELDVFGFDCVEVCTMMHPPLPAVHQPETEIGELAAKYLMDRMDGYTGPVRATRLKCRIVSKQEKR